MLESCDDEQQSPSLAFHIRCASHTLSLVSTTDSKQIGKTLRNREHKTFGKCSALWNASGRPKSAEIIQEVLGCSLQLPAATRWNSFYDAIVLLLKNYDKLITVTIKLNLPSFTEEDFILMNEYVTIMKPIATGLDYLQRDENSHFGILLPTLLAIENKLTELQKKKFSICSDLLKSVHKGFSTRFKTYLDLDFSENCKVAILAAVTHPEYKMVWMKLKDSLNNEQVRVTFHSF